jgi:hypothetical protein
VAIESRSAGAPQALSETMVRTLGQPRGGACSVPIRYAVLGPAERVPRARAIPRSLRHRSLAIHVVLPGPVTAGQKIMRNGVGF